MRANAIIRIVIYSLIIVLLLGLMFAVIYGGKFWGNIDFGINLGGYSYKDSKSYSVGNAEIDYAGIRDIDISWVSGSVSVEAYDGEKIIISEEDSHLQEKELLRYKVSNGKLIIKFKDSGFSWRLFKIEGKNLTLKLPNALAENLNDFSFENVSAEVSIDNLIVRKLDVENVSGSVRLNNITGCGDLDIETVNGDINGSGIEAKEINIESVSGKVSLTSITTNKIDCESVSSDFELDFDECPMSIDVESVSGDVTIYLPENNGFSAKHDSVSGEFFCDFPTSYSKKTTVYKNGSAIFEFETVSGDIFIYSK